MIHNTVKLAGLILIISPLFGINAEAKEKPPVDAVVIMDSSGSMKFTDPRQLRKPAAKLFITLLGSEDKLSVMSFSSKGWPIRIGKSSQFLTQLSSARIKDSAFKATDRISHKGIHTNIHAALARGIELVKQSKQKNRTPIIVLMSDGKMDVGNKKRSQMLRQKTVDELIPLLKKYGIKVYSIAFTQQSDQQLLQQIAESTDGRYALAESDDVLHKAFAKIFEQSKEPNMLPLTENKFMVDASIKEITIIANKKDDKSKIYLESASKKRYNAKQKAKNMKWFVSSSFDMITITAPDEGEWKILFSDDDNKAYIVADMQLRSEFKFDTESASPELTISAWLKKDDNVLANNELINSLELSIEIEHPDQTLEKLLFPGQPKDGVFKTLFKPTMDGVYSATVTATSKTFQRQHFFSFHSIMPQEKPPEPEPEITSEPTTGIEEAPETEPVKETIKEEPESDLKEAIIYFIVGNLILIFIGLNAFFITKMVKKKNSSEKGENNDKEKDKKKKKDKKTS